MYTCERCGYCSLYKGNLKNHLNRKIICNPLLKDIGIAELKEKINKKEKLIKNVNMNVNMNSPNVNMSVNIVNPNVNMNSPTVNIVNPNVNMNSSNYKCKYCFKVFKYRQSRSRHELTNCSKNSNGIEQNKISILTDESNEAKLSKYIKVIEKENELIKKEKKAMRKEIEKLIDKVGNNTLNMIQQNVYINNYGSENLDYLTPGYLGGLLKIPFGSTLKLLKDIHFNPNHPENHNVKIPNRKEKYAIVYTNGDWKLRRKKDVISNMVDMSYNIVDCYFEDNKMILSDRKRNNFIEFQTKYDKDSTLKKGIADEVELELLNH